MKKAVIIQVMIFIAAFFGMTPDQVVDNTYVFGLIGSYDIIPGNTQWVMLGAMILSVINIWVWWPSRKVASTQSETAKEVTKSVKAEEAKAIDEDPKTPTLN